MMGTLHSLVACTACLGAPSSGQTNGMNAAILFLLGALFLVLAFLVFVALRILRQEHVAAAPDSRHE